MNIDDAQTENIEIPKINLVKHLFDHQRALAVKYSPIETKNGFYHPNIDEPPHLDNAKFQHWIKDMFWRATEEIAEALEDDGCMVASRDWRTTWDNDASLRHVYEEFADALHFLAEVSLVVGLDPKHVEDEWDAQILLESDMDGNDNGAMLQSLCGDFIFALGLAANCLKNKPWKVTQMNTDEAKFRHKLMTAWVAFWRIWSSLNWEKSDVYLLYMKKNLTNQFRVRTKY